MEWIRRLPSWSGSFRQTDAGAQTISSRVGTRVFRSALSRSDRLGNRRRTRSAAPRRGADGDEDRSVARERRGKTRSAEREDSRGDGRGGKPTAKVERNPQSKGHLRKAASLSKAASSGRPPSRLCSRPPVPFGFMFPPTSLTITRAALAWGQPRVAAKDESSAKHPATIASSFRLLSHDDPRSNSRDGARPLQPRGPGKDFNEPDRLRDRHQPGKSLLSFQEQDAARRGLVSAPRKRACAVHGQLRFRNRIG